MKFQTTIAISVLMAITSTTYAENCNTPCLVQSSSPTDSYVAIITQPDQSWFLLNDYITASDSDFKIGRVGGGTYSFRIDDDATVDTLAIDVAGRVGINTATPDEELTINSTRPGIRLNDTTAGAWGFNLLADGNLFTLEDALGNNIITVEGNIWNTPLYLDSDGDVGIQVANPVADLQVGGAGDLLLENGTEDWALNADTSYLWFRNGNNTVSGSLPIGFENQTPDYTLVTRNTGNVGIGTFSPQAKLDVRGNIKSTFSGSSTGGLQQLFIMSANNTNLTQKSDAGFVLENARAGFTWAFRTDEDNGGFSASKQGTGARELELINTSAVAGNVELHLANGGKNIGGQWLNASSRSYKENINDLSSEDAMQALKGLKSITYEFKRDKENTQRVGFIAEDVPALLATKGGKTVDSLQIISVLTKAVQVIQAEVNAKDEKIAEMEAKITKLILMQESLAKTVEARFTPFAAETIKVNQQVTALDH